MTLAVMERVLPQTVTPSRRYDERYLPRWEVYRRVDYFEEGKVSFRAYTIDLSLEGAAIFAFGNPSEKCFVQLRIHLTDRASFQILGRVAWSRSEANHKLMGIVFEKLGERERELIMRHAFELRNDPLFVLGATRSAISMERMTNERTVS